MKFQFQIDFSGEKILNKKKFFYYAGMEEWFLIVELDEVKASKKQREFWATLKSGSVVVLVGELLYFEGGLYSRGDRPPTAEERNDYACHAADRGKSKYPTVAMWGPQNGTTGLRVVGQVNPTVWHAIFDE